MKQPLTLGLLFVQRKLFYRFAKLQKPGAGCSAFLQGCNNPTQAPTKYHHLI